MKKLLKVCTIILIFIFTLNTANIAKANRSILPEEILINNTYQNSNFYIAAGYYVYIQRVRIVAPHVAARHNPWYYEYNSSDGRTYCGYLWLTYSSPYGDLMPGFLPSHLCYNYYSGYLYSN